MPTCQMIQTTPGNWECPVCNETITHKGTPRPRWECGKRREFKSVNPLKPSAAPTSDNRQPATPDRDSPCIHRGDVTRQQTCKPCQASGQGAQVDVFECSIHAECTKRNTGTFPRVKACSTCEDYQPLIQLALPSGATGSASASAPATLRVVPGRGGPQAWRGTLARKPWDYDVTAIIPVINPDDSLSLVLDLLRLQTERPYILLIDTGSEQGPSGPHPPLTRGGQGGGTPERFRAVDCEIHYIRSHGAVHPSELVSMAIDTGIALTRTRFTFLTHSDCFLTRRTAIADLKSLAEQHTVAGHQITERQYAGWQAEFGHTLLMCDQDRLNQLGITWSMRRAIHTPGAIPQGVTDYYHDMLAPEEANVVDTERGFNALLQAHGIAPHFTGGEKNYQRNTDEWIDHVRSIPSSTLYQQSRMYLDPAKSWLADAVKNARDRVTAWRNHSQ